MGLIKKLFSHSNEPSIWEDEEKKSKFIDDVSNRDLEATAGPINGVIMKKGERCYLSFTETISWQEPRTTTRRINYSGVSTSIKIVKGVRFRVGSIAPSRQTITTMTEIFSGLLFITNKRLLFTNPNGLKAIQLSAISGLKPYTDAVELFKDSGNQITLSGFDPKTYDALEAYTVITRVLSGDTSGHGSEEPTLIETEHQQNPHNDALTIADNAKGDDGKFISTGDIVADQRLAAKYEKFGDLNSAVNGYLSALELSSNDPMFADAPPRNIFTRLAIIYRKERSYDDEIKILQTALRYYPDDETYSSRIDKARRMAGTASSGKKEQTINTTGNTATQIREFKSLLDDGIITQEEFDEKKKELLGM